VSGLVSLYDLLPEYVRRQDVERAVAPDGSGPLRLLLDAAQMQGDLVYADILRLYDNFFVETCDPWVLPYIADIIGLDLIDDLPADNRRDLARTIAYRRRKGTVSQLETMARDVTSYDCKVVEFFTRMQWTQSMIHLRPDALATVDVRDAATLARIDTAFDRAQHVADVRPAAQTQGLYAIKKIGFYLWRLEAIPLRGVEMAPAPPPAPAGAYHFDVLGQPLPLFAAPPPLERPTDAPWPRVDEFGVRGPISPWLIAESPADFWQTAVVPPGSVARSRGFDVFDAAGNRIVLTPLPADLCDWRRAPAPPVPKGSVAVDVRLGRLLFAPGEAPKGVLICDTFFGLAGEIGGGAYAQDRSLALLPAEVPDVQTVTQTGGAPISAALTALAGSVARVRVVQIADSRTYGNETLPLPAKFETLVIQAAPAQRPTIVLSGTGAKPVFGGNPVQGSLLILRGLQVTGLGETLSFPDGIAEIRLEHCTVDPGGGPSADGVTARAAGVLLALEPRAVDATLSIDHSIIGELKLPVEMRCISIRDSIVDGRPFGAALTNGPKVVVERSTVFGGVSCLVLDASETIFDDVVTVVQRQDGCVRFCSFTPASATPRRYECAPDADRPEFTSTLFREPGYAQLALSSPATIRQGGDDRGEIGVWSSLQEQQRIAHLRLRLAEYLPAGLIPVFVFAT
jgi:hypothetical protein